MRFTVVICFLVLMLIIPGCSQEQGKKEKEYLIKVNNFQIGRDAVNAQLKIEAELDSNFYQSSDVTTEFVRDLIQKQLLIQEAKKQKLDEQEKFRQTIQRHWESTLIRDLLEKKGEEFRKTTVITPAEIEEYYKKNKEFLGDCDFESLKMQLVKKLEDKQVAEKLANWIETLKKEAVIDIKDTELAAKIGVPVANQAKQ